MNNIQKLKNLYSGAVLIESPHNRYYFTNFESSDGILLICDKPYLLLDFRYIEMARKKQMDGEIAEEIQITALEKSLSDMSYKILREHGIKEVAFEDFHKTFHDVEAMRKKFDGIKLVPLGNIPEKLRMIKSPEELLKIEAAQNITDRAFEYILNFINSARTEVEIAAEIEYFMRKNGAFPAFDTICVSGSESSLPHGKPRRRRIIQNSFLTMDFGANLEGYCSDMTRTIVIGKANEKMQEVYSTVLEAQNAAFKVIKGDIIGSDADKAARDVIYSAGYNNCFGHSLGHSLGLEIHEAPNFSPNCKEPIPSGCVLSVEPGIYIEGLFGVRIEDIIFLTQDGYKNLTKSSKKLIEV